MTAKELEELVRLEAQLEKVRKAFSGKKVTFRGDAVYVSNPGSNIEIEYRLKDVLRVIKKKEQGTTLRHSNSRVASKYSRATHGKSATRRKTKRASAAVGFTNAVKRAEIRAMENRLRALRLAERLKKKALREAAAGGAGAGGSPSRSTSGSRSGSSHSNNNMNALIAGLGDMSVAEVKSEIAQLEEALARMGL